jgi:hypothetical protein
MASPLLTFSGISPGEQGDVYPLYPTRESAQNFCCIGFPLSKALHFSEEAKPDKSTWHPP